MTKAPNRVQRNTLTELLTRLKVPYKTISGSKKIKDSTKAKGYRTETTVLFLVDGDLHITGDDLINNKVKNKKSGNKIPLPSLTSLKVTGDVCISDMAHANGGFKPPSYIGGDCKITDNKNHHLSDIKFNYIGGDLIMERNSAISKVNIQVNEVNDIAIEENSDLATVKVQGHDKKSKVYGDIFMQNDKLTDVELRDIQARGDVDLANKGLDADDEASNDDISFIAKGTFISGWVTLNSTVLPKKGNYVKSLPAHALHAKKHYGQAI